MFFKVALKAAIYLGYFYKKKLVPRTFKNRLNWSHWMQTKISRIVKLIKSIEKLFGGCRAVQNRIFIQGPWAEYCKNFLAKN